MIKIGLDMYLDDKKGKELIYWRKANAIHRWFAIKGKSFNATIDGIPISLKDLEELKELIDKVLEARSEEVSRNLLPTTSGFFFGDLDYNEYYYIQLKHTQKKIDEILSNRKMYEIDETFDKGSAFIYTASW